MPNQPTVEVVPNPYAALDVDGVPQGAVGLSGSRSFIGADVDLQLSQKEGKTRFYFPGFPKRTFKVPFDATVVNAINEGSLIAATTECARKCGFAGDFLPIADALAAEKKKALANLRAARGESASIGEVPTELAPVEDPVDATKAVALSGPKDSPNLVAPPAPKER